MTRLNNNINGFNLLSASLLALATACASGSEMAGFAPQAPAVEETAPAAAPRSTTPASEAGGALASDAWLHGSAGHDDLRGTDAGDLMHAYAGDDVLHGYAGSDHLFGNDGDDLVIGGTGSDEVTGGAGNDRVVGGTGDDVLEGGEGDDVLEGGEGDDRYVFAAGFGSDVVRERAHRHSGRDQLEFRSLTSARAELLRTGDDLTIADRDSDDKVTIEGYFQGDESVIESVRFADGEELDLAAMLAKRAVKLALAAR